MINNIDDAWEFALGMAQVEGVKPDADFLELVERNKRGEISHEKMSRIIDERFASLTKNAPTAQDIEKRIKKIVGTFRVDGMMLEDETIAGIRKCMSGEMTYDEALAMLYEKYTEVNYE